MNKSTPLIYFFYSASFMWFISTNQWFMLWVGLELNTIMFLPVFFKKKNMMNLEASILYFILQSTSSLLLLFALVENETQTANSSTLKMFIFMSLLFKMASAPFHTWFPMVCFSSSTWSLWLLLTMQKMLPMLFLIFLKPNIMLITFFIIASAWAGPLLNFKQNNLKMIMIFSSISHISWMLVSIMSTISGWGVYFLTYSLLCNLVIFNLYLYKSEKYLEKKEKMMKMMIFILGLSGLPPFLGFYPKILIIETSLQKMMSLTILAILMSTVIDFFIYLHIFYSVTLYKQSHISWKMKFLKFSKVKAFFLYLVIFSSSTVLLF